LSYSFPFSDFEHKTLEGKKHFIAKEFDKYIENYTGAIKKKQTGVLKKINLDLLHYRNIT
jgi:hypothetical protein